MASIAQAEADAQADAGTGPEAGGALRGAGVPPAALGCDQARAAVAALRPAIAANGPEALQVLLSQTDALLQRSTHWSKCQRAARYKTILTAAQAAGLPVRSPGFSLPPAQLPTFGTNQETGGSRPAPTAATPDPSEASGPPKPQADAGLLPYNTKPSPEPLPFFDLVVPLGTGSKHDNLELRYLLRSALANLSQPINRQDAKDAKGNQGEGGTAADPPQAASSLGELGALAVQPSAPTDHGPLTTGHGLRTIHLIGPKRPAWLHDHPMIRWHQWTPIKPKNHDIVAKFIHAANHPDVAEHFLAACDDFLFLKPFRPGLDYGAVRRHGVLSNKTGEGYWKKAQAETRRLLEAAGRKPEYFDYHVPTLMTKTGWRQVDAEIPWKSVPGHAVWSLYHNVAGVHGPSIGNDGQSHAGWHAGDGSSAPATLDDVERAAFGRLFLNYNDGGLRTGIVATWLAHRYPDPAPWEQDHLERGREEQRRKEQGANRQSEIPPTSVPCVAASPQGDQPQALSLSKESKGFTPSLLAALTAAGLRIEHPELAAYHARWQKLLSTRHETKPLPPPGLVTIAEPGNAHLGDQIAISNLPRLLAAKGYTVRVDDTRSAHAVFDGNPHVAGFGRQGQVLTPWICRTERGHVIQRFCRAWNLEQIEFPAGEIYLSPEELAWAREQRAAWPADKPVILLSTGAVSSRDGYLAVDWQAITDALLSTCTVVSMIVTRPEAHVGTSNANWQKPKVADFRPDGCIVFENLPTRQFMALFAVADGAIGTMGGSCHVAAALGIPYLCVLPTERNEGFDLQFPQLGKNGVSDARWIYPQHTYAIASDTPLGFPLTRSQLRDQVIHPSERANVSAGQLSHILSKYLIARRWYLARPAGSPRPRIVEVGVRYGYSAVAWCLACPDADYHGIDIICDGSGAHGGKGGGEDTFPYVRDLLARLCPTATVTLTHLNSQAMPAFPPANLFHGDGDHSTQGALGDACKAWTALLPGGIMIMDDYDYIADVKSACDVFATQNAAEIGDVRRVPSWRGEFVVRKPGQRRIVNVHYLTSNCGDANAGVARYFPGIEERSLEQPAVAVSVAIFGGGGVYHRGVFANVARKYRDLGAKVVLWGAGVVTEDRAKGMTPFAWREFGDSADLCGLREASPWEFVPCPSCMSPLFDSLRSSAPLFDTVYYNHPDKPVPDGTPRMGNRDTTDMATALRFLASGRRVVTSSYHGRIWATWLGREVVLAGPAAEQLAASGPIPPLEEARTINQSFYQRLLEVAKC